MSLDFQTIITMFFMNVTKKIAGASLVLLAMTACSHHEGWSVKGTLEGASDGTKLAVEACNAGHWYVLDSVDVSKDGRFEYKSAEPAAIADIMRVILPGKGSVYFPVEGTDAVTINANASTFGTGHRLGGTDMAHAVGAVDSIVASTSDVAELQKKLAGFIVSDTTGIVAYYTVGKSVGNTLIFNPKENFGNRIYGAAAQVYAHYKPEDPHGDALKAAFFEGRRALGKIPEGESGQVIEVPESGLIEISRYDNRGELHSLSEVAGKGNVVLLSFTAYDQQFSPAYNSILNDLYTLYHDKGLEIYQIAFDNDEVAWKEAALNLPWVTVWNSGHDGAAVLNSYNVGALPMTFIIDRQGNLTSRVVDPTDLPKQVGRMF